MATKIERVTAGGVVRARTINDLIDATRRGQVKVGRGLAAVNTPTGMLIALLERERVVWGRITAVHGLDPDDPTNISYDIAALGGKFIDLVGMTPTMGRPSRPGDFKIRPGHVGDLVEIIRSSDAEGAITADLRISTEVIAPSDCPPPEP